VTYEWDPVNAATNVNKHRITFEKAASVFLDRSAAKYYKQAVAGTNLVLLEPDVARAFPDSSSVNRALRLLQEVATKSSKHARTSAGARRRATG
jgi:hypothetical protein